MGTAGEARTSEKVRAALMLWGTRWENDTFGICPSTSQVMGSPPAYSAPSPSFAVEPGERVAALDGQPADRRPGEGLSPARPVPDAHQDGDKSGDHIDDFFIGWLNPHVRQHERTDDGGIGEGLRSRCGPRQIRRRRSALNRK
jgi:hypothetical protein